LLHLPYQIELLVPRPFPTALFTELTQNLPESGDVVESVDDSNIVDVDNGEEFDWLPEKG
jgi:hypothetical protein